MRADIPLRVLLLIRAATGGMRRHVSLLADGLLKRSVQVTVAAPEDFSLEGDSGLPIHRIPISPGPLAIPFADSGLRIASLAQDADIVHAHGLMAAWPAALGTRRSRKPFIFTAHNLAPSKKSWLTARLIRWTANRA